MKTIPILRNDVLKSVYFIVCLAQDQTGSAMHGSLTSKGDLIGGIFDRWINTFPEAIVFNKEILASIAGKHDVKIISDFYSYNPLIAGIAPDVIGLKIDGRVEPFVKFNDHWVPVEGAPQIEIKTFKKPQKMVSLRNQGYENEYLVLVESDFRIDYLVPFFDKAIFGYDVYDELKMDNRHFVVSDVFGQLKNFPEVDSSFDQIGTVGILRITKSDDFMNNSTHCEGRVSVQRVSNIEEYNGNRVREEISISVSSIADKLPNGLYRFNSNWYDAEEDGIPCFTKRGINHKTRCLDFQCTNPSHLKIIKKISNGYYLMADEVASFNMISILPGRIYKVTTNTLDREGNDGDEYFFQKELLSFIPNKENDLKADLKKYIK